MERDVVIIYFNHSFINGDAESIAIMLTEEVLLAEAKESIDEQRQLAERIAYEQAVCADMQESMTIIREDHSTRITRLEEAMVSIKHSIASIDAKLDRLLLK